MALRLEDPFRHLNDLKKIGRLAPQSERYCDNRNR